MYLGNDPAMNPRIRNTAQVRKLMRKLRRGDDIRRAKIKSLRSDISSGAYENDLKLSIALDRLLDDVAGY